ncbi:hypothetical protein HOB25_00005 [bacterium]|nr:hypothetical protein [bacterium]
MLEAVSFIDNSRRITGGGYVFHSEGDIVFSCVGSLSDLYFPKKMKEKMGWVSDLVAELLVKNGVKVQIESKAFSMANIDFCASYYNPYELYVDGYKICGITIRKLKKSFIIQGVLHVFSNINSFEQLTGGFLPFLTQGLRYKSIVDGDVFYNNLLDSLK